MKKIIITLLLIQTAFFAFADEGCMKFNYRLGEKPVEHTQCHCNCEQHKQLQSNRKQCIECGHFRIPKAMNFSQEEIVIKSVKKENKKRKKSKKENKTKSKDSQ